MAKIDELKQIIDSFPVSESLFSKLQTELKNILIAKSLQELVRNNRSIYLYSTPIVKTDVFLSLDGVRTGRFMVEAVRLLYINLVEDYDKEDEQDYLEIINKKFSPNIWFKVCLSGFDQDIVIGNVGLILSKPSVVSSFNDEIRIRQYQFYARTLNSDREELIKVFNP